ncbi:hypothetical protein C8A00DRAFT_11138 [Chaetomidium leptoderma]|uniref:RNA ligase domain-containing protein n=1 Tax=Chaetomidium leptoderma TaxID=669021 RepID=A0AAN6VVI5_9PEZI|nr:hypothetical protein C8A00DRAFT_11138 [Chaetomidium leptoderma]
MTPRESPAMGHGADSRAWLEAAILSSNATLPGTLPGTLTSTTNSETAAESSEAAAQSSGLATTELEGPMKRKLATVRFISEVTWFDEGYDVITLDGWKVVAAVKNTKRFAEGEYVLFLEVDSFLPAGALFGDSLAGRELMFDCIMHGEAGYRVGTSLWVDWEGNQVISQGHVFHLSDFPDINRKVCRLHWERIEQPEEEFAEFIRDIDFSDDVGIKKWESFPEIDAATVNDHTDNAPTSNPKTPSFVVKTDMGRVQNCPNLFVKPKYQLFLFQESIKMDGASMTIYYVTNDSMPTAGSDLPRLPALDYANTHTFLQHAVHPSGRLGVCTRNQDLLPHQLPSKTVPSHNHYWTAAIAANLHQILPFLNRDMAIQAELVGATIQGNPYGYPQTPTIGGRPTHELFVFSITDIPSKKRWHPRKVEAFAAQHGLKHVPVLGYHTVPSVARHHQDLLDRAELKRGEGLVFKNCTDGRWFKVLSNRWILEKGDEMHAAKAAAKAKAKGKGKEKEKVGGEEEVVIKGWEASKEEVDTIRKIFENLEEWMRRDDGLKKWMEEWERGWQSGVVTKVAAKGAGGMDSGGGTGKGRKAAAATQNGQTNNGFGVSEAKRKELADWLRIDESAL